MPDCTMLQCYLASYHQPIILQCRIAPSSSWIFTTEIVPAANVHYYSYYDVETDKSGFGVHMKFAVDLPTS